MLTLAVRNEAQANKREENKCRLDTGSITKRRKNGESLFFSAGHAWRRRENFMKKMGESWFFSEIIVLLSVRSVEHEKLSGPRNEGLVPY